MSKNQFDLDMTENLPTLGKTVWNGYEFDPQPDITVHELAVCVKLLLGYPSPPEDKLTWIGVMRHFRPIE